jgi:hypothetical protein
MKSKHSGFNRMDQVFLALCKQIDTPISLGAWLRYKHGEHLALAKMSISEDTYLDAESFKKDYLAIKFLSKWKGLKTGVNLEEEALLSFKLSEERCLATNRRLKEARFRVIDPDVSSVLYGAKRKIAKLLGEFSWDKVRSGYGWGPGSTDDIPLRNAQVDRKVCKLPISVTADARAVFQQELRGDLHWLSVILGETKDKVISIQPNEINPVPVLPRDALVIVDGCIITTVPKDAKTDRVIAKEPRANGFLQKGFGSYFRKRLKRYGIDLDSQVPNQEAARRALQDGLATLDLKAASDSVATELVYELLPVEWFLALDSCRSKSASLPDKTHIRLEKFSSMGNGFTFELETLLFWSLLTALRDKFDPGSEVLVYGDDIVCSKELSAKAIQLLNFVGFEVNEEKSFVSGQFYESCGEHFFGSHSVTPIYQKELIESPIEVVLLGNRLIRASIRYSYSKEGLWPLLENAWRAARRCDTSMHRYFLPLGSEGDDGWLLPMSEFPRTATDANLGLRCRVFRQDPKSLPAPDSALLAIALRRGSSGSSRLLGMSSVLDCPLPFLGMVEVFPQQDEERGTLVKLKSTHRWLNPTGEFTLDYNN